MPELTEGSFVGITERFSKVTVLKFNFALNRRYQSLPYADAIRPLKSRRISNNSLQNGQQGDYHRSTSPNTMSMAESTAVTSASMWPFIMKSIACRCEKPVGRILQR